MMTEQANGFVRLTLEGEIEITPLGVFVRNRLLDNEVTKFLMSKGLYIEGDEVGGTWRITLDRVG